MYTDQAYKRTQPKPKEEKREGRKIRREGGRRERREGIGKEGGRWTEAGEGEMQGQGMKPASQQLNATSGHMSDSPEDHKQKPHKGLEGPPWTCS